MGAQESCVFNAVKQFDIMLLEMKGLAASCMSTLVVFFYMLNPLKMANNNNFMYFRMFEKGFYRI